MGWEYEPETVWRAQELYCVDRLSFARVAELTGVSATTLKSWSEKYGWKSPKLKAIFASIPSRAERWPLNCC